MGFQLLIPIFFALFCSEARSALSDLDTDRKRLEWLLAINKEVPSLFTQSVKYDIDLMAIASDQNRLRNRLIQNPHYERELQNSLAQLREIDIHPKVEQRVKSYRIREGALEQWKGELKRAFLAIHPDPGQTMDLTIERRILELARELNHRNSQGLITGLALTLSERDKAIVFQAKTLGEKLSLLEQKLPEILSDKFRAADWGMNPQPSRSQTLLQLKKLVEAENSLRELTQLSLVLSESGARAGLKNIEALGREQLQLFTDPDALRPRIRALVQKLGAAANPVNVNGERLTKLVESGLREYSEPVEELEETLKAGLRLRQVPPDVGIFRGFPGGDCSTATSFGYPNSPQEQIYFVYDEGGALKGYVSATVLKAGDKKSLYVITVAGPRISSGDTRLILEGLHQARAQLGVDQIVLPLATKAKRLINYSEIRSVYDEIGKTGKRVKLKYLDEEFRQEIERFRSINNNAQYDKIISNQFGIVYNSDRGASPLLKAELKSSPMIDLTPVPVTRREVSEFALNLRSAGRYEQSKRVYAAAGFNPSDLDDLVAVIENAKGRKTVAEIRAQVSALADWPSEEVLKKDALLMDGFYQSPDFEKYLDAPEFQSYFLNKLDLAGQPRPGFNKIPEHELKLLFSGGRAAGLTQNMLERKIPGEMRFFAKYVFSDPKYAGELKPYLRKFIDESDRWALQELASAIPRLEAKDPGLSLHYFEALLKAKESEIAPFALLATREWASRPDAMQLLLTAVEQGDAKFVQSGVQGQIGSSPHWRDQYQRLIRPCRDQAPQLFSSCVATHLKAELKNIRSTSRCRADVSRLTGYLIQSQ